MVILELFCSTDTGNLGLGILVNHSLKSRWTWGGEGGERGEGGRGEGRGGEGRGERGEFMKLGIWWNKHLKRSRMV